jgi:hypothetical protein
MPSSSEVLFIVHCFVYGSCPVEVSFQVSWLSSLIIKSVEALLKLRETLVEGTLLFLEALYYMSEIGVLGSGLLSRRWDSHRQLARVAESHISRGLLPSLGHS